MIGKGAGSARGSIGQTGPATVVGVADGEREDGLADGETGDEERDGEAEGDAPGPVEVPHAAAATSSSPDVRTATGTRPRVRTMTASPVERSHRIRHLQRPLVRTDRPEAFVRAPRPGGYTMDG